MPRPVLAITGLASGYPGRPVLRGVTFEVYARETIVICGANGAGKSTLLKALFGLLGLSEGEIRLEGIDISPLSPQQRLLRGIAFVPQGGRVFGRLTVAENLRVCATSTAATVQEAVTNRLGRGIDSTRRASTLSGGERQMLALAMGLQQTPRVLLVDEPSLALSSSRAQALFEHLREIGDSTGAAVIMVEHRLQMAAPFADRVIILRDGEMSFIGDALVLDRPEEVRQYFFGAVEHATKEFAD